jgi:DNA-binding response OmpR family regulator
MNAVAGDYSHGPLDPSRFVARVKAALRRARA